MSQTYKFKSLEIEGKSTVKSTEDISEVKSFITGSSKTVDFILKDGTRYNFPYSRYLSTELSNDDGTKILKVSFVDSIITVKGYGLESLYEHLIQANVSKVFENDERYYQENNQSPFVTEIDISKE